MAACQIGATITAANDFQAAGSYGQLVLVAEDNSGNYYLIPTTSQPLPILFWSTLSANLLSGDATIGVAAGVTQIFGTMPATGVTANNNLSLSGQNGTPCLVAGDATVVDGLPAPNYYLLAVDPSVMYWATLDGTLLATDATVEATVDTNILGWAPAGAATCNNRLGLSGASGSLVLVVERESNGDFDIIAIKPSGGGCTFTLSSPYSAGAASATVGTPWARRPTPAEQPSRSTIRNDCLPGL